MTATFAGLLRQYRERRGLSQNALARAVDLSPSMVNMLEGDERRATREQVRRIARALELDATETDEVLVAAGHLPAAFDLVPPTDPDLLLVARTLADAAVEPTDKARLRAMLRLFCSRWHPEAFDLSPFLGPSQEPDAPARLS